MTTIADTLPDRRRLQAVLEGSDAQLVQVPRCNLARLLNRLDDLDPDPPFDPADDEA